MTTSNTIAHRIMADYSPQTVLLMGHEIGFLVEAFRKGGLDASGVNIPENTVETVDPEIKPYCRVGTVLEELTGRYDLIACLDVLQDIPVADAEAAIGNLCRHAEAVIFSSTPEGADDLAHLNDHNPDYWAGLFSRHGFIRDMVADLAYIHPWAMRFVRGELASQELVQKYERKLWQVSKASESLEREISALQHSLDRRERASQEANLQLNEIYSSTAWKIIQLMWKLRLRIAPHGSKREEWGRKLVNLARRRPSSRPIQKVVDPSVEGSAAPMAGQHWGLMATDHTLYVAGLLARRLQAHGCKVTLTTGELEDFSLDRYIVICPQMFKSLPPPEKRFAFQLEQSVSSRWFTQDYFRILDESAFILDYSLKNIEFLAKNGLVFPKIYYLPIGAMEGQFEAASVGEKKADILFYGDLTSSPRRQKMLEALKSQFSVRIVEGTYGEPMQEIIREARLVINLHYYENALLEAPRILECVSMGVPVLSEEAQDQDEYPELGSAVRFFENGSIPAMLEAARDMLENPVTPDQIQKSIQDSARRFDFMFDRFLLGTGFLPVDYLQNIRSLNVTGRMVLSLPETIDRRRSFQSMHLAGYSIFDGLRHSIPWMGACLSYSALARSALDAGLGRLTVMEDDIALPGDFGPKMRLIHEFLDKEAGEWDIFAGVIASLHPWLKILDVQEYQGIRFVKINKMVSMVCNIYDLKALHILAAWDPGNNDPETNTIDKYLESQGDLRIIVALPFLAGHREEAGSTIWGFQNSYYGGMIRRAERELLDKSAAYLARRSGKSDLS